MGENNGMQSTIRTANGSGLQENGIWNGGTGFAGNREVPTVPAVYGDEENLVQSPAKPVPWTQIMDPPPATGVHVLS